MVPLVSTLLSRITFSRTILKKRTASPSPCLSPSMASNASERETPFLYLKSRILRKNNLMEALKIPKFYSSNPIMFPGPYNNTHEQLLFTCHICKKQGTAQIWNSEFLFGYSL